MSLLNDFLGKVVSDCVNGSSEVSAYAAGLRQDAHDVAEGRGGWDGKLSGWVCRSCGRTSLDVEDGWCGQCNYEPAPTPTRALWLSWAKVYQGMAAINPDPKDREELFALANEAIFKAGGK